MRGGKSVRIQCGCALRKTSIALLAIHFAWTSSATNFLATAHPGHDDEHCAPKLTQEQSIVVSAKKLSDQQDASAAETMADEGALKPIAKVSPLVPELAEPLKVAQVPTLADPLPAKQAIQPVSQSKPAPQPLEPTEPVVAMAETEVISFHGITPGLSKRINVLRTWGDPRSDDTQAEQLKYRFDTLQAVWVRFQDNLVTTIEVELAKPAPVEKLARKLNLQAVRPVVTRDEDGTATAQAYPERGVILQYASNELGLTIASDDTDSSPNPRVSNIVIQPIEADLFLARAEASVDTHYTYAIADLEAALRLDSQLSSARAQLAKIYATVGKVVTAEKYAAEAVENEPQNAAHRLQWAKCLRLLARYDLAVEQVRTVLETPNVASLVRAQALNEMGLLASLGSDETARNAMKLHSKAIEIADRLAVGRDVDAQLPAKKLLVEAHLAMAVEISRGDWQQKDETVPQWIERSSALAEALIDEDTSYLPLRLQVAVSSLAAAANLDQPINPLLWVEEAEETVADLRTQIFDSLALSQYEWQLGLAYFHGSQIEHRRSEPDSAIHLGELADGQLAELALQRDEMPDTAYLMGRLYFQIGAVHAVHYEDHITACQWYDDAVDRLLNPVPVTTMATPQQHGDALVSMGVSYWSQGDRQRAIEVTKAGVELIEEAVDSGLLGKETLMVSYNNLSAMYQTQGDSAPAARYERLAKQITGTQVAEKERTSRSQRR